MDPNTVIPEMFNGKCIFITGVTGFVGKVLLEKLIRSCPGIARVLVLIRSNSKQTPAERLQKLFESSVFDRIKSECPERMNKIQELDGDVTKQSLSLKEEEIQMMTSDVNFVFHCAASVRFENDPRNTLEINLLGVKNVLTLCQSMKRLHAVVHVSTAYSFCNQEVIGEKFYPEAVTQERIENVLGSFNDDQLKELCAVLSASRPSLYQYSKALAELLIKDMFIQLPIIIVRPAIITAAFKEPFPGWIDNYNGPSGFIALSSKGILKTLLVDPNIKADWVPVDVVVNTLIVSAYFIARRRLEMQSSFEVVNKDLELSCYLNSIRLPVINCVCPETNSITWSKIVEICIPLLYKYPSFHVYRLPGGTVTSSRILHNICKYVFHYCPAVFMDLTRLLIFKERKYVNQYKQIHKVLDFLQVYTMNKFTFTFQNMTEFISEYSRDNSIFYIDQNRLDWNQYLDDYVHGVRHFFLKEDDSTLPAAHKKIFGLKCLYYGGQIALGSVLLAFLLRKRLWHKTLYVKAEILTSFLKLKFNYFVK